MSIPKIQSALETALATIAPPIDTAYENTDYTPVVDREYQEAWLLPATPENPTMGEAFHRQAGIFLVKLQYPPRKGSAPAAARAELIAALFKRGASFVKGGVVVQIERTPEIGAGRPEEGRWVVPVRIRWFSNISI